MLYFSKFFEVIIIAKNCYNSHYYHPIFIVPFVFVIFTVSFIFIIFIVPLYFRRSFISSIHRYCHCYCHFLFLYHGDSNCVSAEEEEEAIGINNAVLDHQTGRDRCQKGEHQTTRLSFTPSLDY